MSMRTMVSLRWAAVAAIATLVGAWGGPAQAAPQHYRCITKQFSGDEAHMFAIREKRIAIELDPKTRRWYVDPGLMGGNHYPDTSDDLVVMHEFVTELPLSEDAETFPRSVFWRCGTSARWSFM